MSSMKWNYSLMIIWIIQCLHILTHENLLWVPNLAPLTYISQHVTWPITEAWGEVGEAKDKFEISINLGTYLVLLITDKHYKPCMPESCYNSTHTSHLCMYTVQVHNQAIHCSNTSNTFLVVWQRWCLMHECN